jgi:hypothetical protein
MNWWRTRTHHQSDKRQRGIWKGVVRPVLLGLGWIVGIPSFFVLSAFFFMNRKAPDALAAVSIVGGAILGIYGIFVFGGGSQDKPKGGSLLSVLLMADVLLLGLWVQFMAHDVPVDPPRDVVVAYVWDINTGEMFPKGTLPVSKPPWSYAYLAERLVQQCLKQGVLKEPQEPRVGILANRCGLLPGYDLTQVILLEYLGMVFGHSWEAKFTQMPGLAGERRAGIEQYTGGRKGRAVTHDDLLSQPSDNHLIRFLSPHYRLMVPSDVKLMVGKGPVMGHDAFRHILFEGHYCDAMILLRGGVAGAKYPDQESTARRTEVDVRLVANCSKALRGHPEMTSRIDWVNRLMSTIDNGLSVESLARTNPINR